MAEFVNKRNINFLLNEVFNAESLTEYSYYGDHSSETFNMIIDTALDIGTDLMYPVFSEMDKNPPVYEDGIVKVHPSVRQYLDVCGDGGWINATWDYDQGGQRLPIMIKFISNFIFTAANYPLAIYPIIITGAVNLMNEFASQEIKDKYLENLLNTKWQGTMALTEPNVGSSLGDLTTSAEDTGEGYYKIKGNKIFISSGHTDIVENTVHMMLARIKGAPAGAKGISLFVVPHYRVNDDGSQEYNDLECVGIEHKMGYRGCAICQLSMGENNDCHGYLVGEPGKGLTYMFQMMNEERLGVGIGAIGKMTACYYAALEYTQQRLQGRKTSQKDPSTPMVPIIEHSDVKRMLLFQRAISEGALSLAVQFSKYMDLAIVSENAEEKEKYNFLIELLVPIVKTYPAEMGILSTSAAIQCLGGYGYCQDFPVEQYFRDIRIDTIHEGTTYIHGMDILGRKIIMKNGLALKAFIDEVQQTINEAGKYKELKEYANELSKAINTLQEVTKHLLALSSDGKKDEFFSDATLYLELFSIIAIAWQWLLQSITASNSVKNNNLLQDDKLFYEGKLYTCRFFYKYELPKVDYLFKTLMKDDFLTVEMDSKYL